MLKPYWSARFTCCWTIARSKMSRPMKSKSSQKFSWKPTRTPTFSANSKTKKQSPLFEGNFASRNRITRFIRWTHLEWIDCYDFFQFTESKEAAQIRIGRFGKFVSRSTGRSKSAHTVAWRAFWRRRAATNSGRHWHQTQLTILGWRDIVSQRIMSLWIPFQHANNSFLSKHWKR